VRLRNARRGVGLGPKSETELLGLGFGHAVWNGNGGQWVGVGWWSVQGSGGGGVVRSQNGRQGVGLVKSPKPSRCGSVSVAPFETATEDIA
jgi:hypothetical protein